MKENPISTYKAASVSSFSIIVSRRKHANVPMLADLEVPRPNAHHIIEGEVENEAAFADNFGEHRFNVLGDHLRVLRIHRDARVVEGLACIPQYKVELNDTTFEDRSEEAWNQGPTDGCQRNQNGIVRTTHQTEQNFPKLSKSNCALKMFYSRM